MSVMYISGGIYEQMNDMCIYMQSNEPRKVCARVCAGRIGPGSRTGGRSELIYKIMIVKVIVVVKLSIHPSVPSAIHGWRHTGKKTLTK
jgi:hypothetical protein